MSIIREMHVKFFKVPGIYTGQWNVFQASGVICATGLSLHRVMATEKFGLGVGGALACVMFYRTSLSKNQS